MHTLKDAGHPSQRAVWEKKKTEEIAEQNAVKYCYKQKNLSFREHATLINLGQMLQRSVRCHQPRRSIADSRVNPGLVLFFFCFPVKRSVAYDIIKIDKKQPLIVA